MAVFGIRGATTVEANEATDILTATKELLGIMLRQNGLKVEELAGVFLTTTRDLDAVFPAQAARDLGWDLVPLLGGVEAAVKGSLERCVRVLILANTDKTQREIRHVYLRGAASLRPDMGGDDR